MCCHQDSNEAGSGNNVRSAHLRFKQVSLGGEFPRVSVAPRVPRAVQSLPVPGLTGEALGLLQHFCPRKERQTDGGLVSQRQTQCGALRGSHTDMFPVLAGGASCRPVSSLPSSLPPCFSKHCGHVGIVSTGGHDGHCGYGWSACYLQPRVCWMDAHAQACC